MTPGQAPIGVFDSGVGGLSVLRALRRRLPDERLVYLADSANAPYGDRDAGFIEARTLAAAGFLAGQGARAIVVACNTASVVAVDRLRACFALPIVAMEPAIKPAVAITRSGVVGVLATSRTLASPSVARLCRLHGEGARILLQACPGWVEQVEQGLIDSPATLRLVEACVRPLVAAGADTLVLGCTHYPFLARQIREVAGEGVTLVDPSDAVARQVERKLPGPAAPAAEAVEPGAVFFTTGGLDAMKALVSALWGGEADVRGAATLR